ncbi:hypothetical protein CBR_g23483 [Chara braunii]|uniref:Translation initiation factor eIF2B subunit epsilon n=1 Tax=Chara braunii TaxID=69332 RepID=A0A388L4C2_CHABU|nr:hypothetical protein CBR_g23483 [Chara braunii]|eukprot:GBG77156.1 hypothetical protein CBR_g23483 [Chara braunii]
MATPKVRKSTAVADDTDVTVPLQAVVVVDSFDPNFRPVSLEKPSALFPLVNIPLINYTLEWLQSAGVEDVFVLICCSQSKQVLSHLESLTARRTDRSDFNASSSYKLLQRGRINACAGRGGGGGGENNFKVTPVVAQNCTTMGDALRFIDGKGVIRGDFILVRGHTIGNFSLADALEEHRCRRKKAKQAVMTMLFRRCKSLETTRQTRFGGNELLVVIDSTSKQLLVYDDGSKWPAVAGRLPKLSPGQMGRNHVRQAGSESSAAAGRAARCTRLDSGDLKRRTAVQLRMDLVDCFIDICAPEVLSLFTDNFDYQTLRKDFVKGLLSDDITGNEIHIHELPEDSYGARVDTWRAYDAVSKDVIRGWAHPFRPPPPPPPLDTRHGPIVCSSAGDTWAASPPDDDQGRRRHRHVSVAASAVVGANVVLGDGCSIGEGTVIWNSVLGPECRIGCNVKISGSYLWHGATVGDNVEVAQAVLCDHVVVMNNVRIQPGAVISSNVAIGAGHTVSRYSRISLKPPREKKGEKEGDGEEGEEEEDEDEDDEQFSCLTSRGTPPGTPIAAGSGGGGGGGVARPEAIEHAACRGSDDEGGKREHVDERAWRGEEVGQGGKGFLWRWPKQDADDEWRLSIGAIPEEKKREMATLVRSEADVERLEDDSWFSSAKKPITGAIDSQQQRARSNKKLDGANAEEEGDEDEEREEEEEEEEEDDEDGGREFEREVIETVKRIVSEGVKIEDANLEIMALKLAYNKEFADCAGGVLKAMLEAALSNKPYSKPAELFVSLKKMVQKLSPLMKKFLKDADDEVEMLLALEEVCMDGPPGTTRGGLRSFGPIFVNVLELLYNTGLVREESILTWEEEKKGAVESDRVFVKQCETFLKWLREADEEEDEEEGDD